MICCIALAITLALSVNITILLKFWGGGQLQRVCTGGLHWDKNGMNVISFRFKCQYIFSEG